ncbi:transposase [Streptomyces triticiradicis]|uniref:transposase n=1 Tax=Streptomyces triticiradicis TaxID=2651189 RepID=UPI001CECA3D8
MSSLKHSPSTEFPLRLNAHPQASGLVVTLPLEWSGPVRLLRALPLPQPESVPCLGVDEFAVHRGRTYATILVDMDTHRPVDVLTDRTAHTFAVWRREHPEVRVVCRDRAGSFRDGAQVCAPQARQVANAWHLLQNLAETVEHIVGRHRADLREPLTVQASQDDVRPTTPGGTRRARTAAPAGRTHPRTPPTDPRTHQTRRQPASHRP